MQLEKYNVISFDIFDTLVFRNVSHPSKVFELVQKKYNEETEEKIKNFKVNRIIAEKEARKSASEEVTIDEIYDYISLKYGESISEKLKEYEKEIEILICTPNSKMFEIYKKYISKKQIIITSDMYLDRQTIERILSKCGYEGYYKLYLSSEIKLTKHSGNLFEYIKEDLKNVNKIIHIGDNKRNDVIMPIIHGLSSKLVKNKNKNVEYNSINEELLFEFIQNNANSCDYFEKFGYSILGPLVLFFLKWLYHNVSEKDIKKIFFFSRDAYILNKAYDILYDDQDISAQYFYASRRAIIVPFLHKCEDIKKIINSIHWSKYVKIEDLLKKVGLDDYDLYDILEKNKLTLDYVIETTDMINNKKINAFLSDIYPYIIRNSKIEYENFMQYIKLKGFCGKVAIVDIGWFGNMQKAIENIIPQVDINGFYLGLNPDGKNQAEYKMSGFLFDKNHGKDIYQVEKSINSLFELFFTAPHGSVKCYNLKKEENVELYPYEFENEKYSENIFKMQNAALNFIREFKSIQKYFKIEISVEKIIQKLLDIAINPSLEDAKKLGNFVFLDEGVNYIAKPCNFTDYIIKPQKLIKDIKNSTWKVGFLKRLFKIKLPYYKVYNKLANK